MRVYRLGLTPRSHKHVEDNEENGEISSKKKRHFINPGPLQPLGLKIPMGSSPEAIPICASPNHFPSCAFRLPETQVLPLRKYKVTAPLFSHPPPLTRESLRISERDFKSHLVQLPEYSPDKQTSGNIK